MLIALFDMSEGVLVPSIHCYSLNSLKSIIEAYPKDHIKVFKYIFYKTCSDPKMNPFFNLPDEDKEELILQEVKVDFSIDDPLITKALEVCEKLYDTPTKRAYEGMKILVDRLGDFFKKNALSTGRDGSLTAMVSAGKDYQNLRQSFKGVEKDYMEEIEQVRGAQFTAYDQR